MESETWNKKTPWVGVWPFARIEKKSTNVTSQSIIRACLQRPLLLKSDLVTFNFVYVVILTGIHFYVNLYGYMVGN